MIFDPANRKKDDDDLAGAGQELAGAGRGEKRSEKGRDDPPIRLISVSREEHVGEQRGADEVISSPETFAFKLDNSRFPSQIQTMFLDVPVRRSMNINDTDLKWVIHYGEVLRGEVVGHKWIRITDEKKGTAYLPRHINNVLILEEIDEET